MDGGGGAGMGASGGDHGAVGHFDPVGAGRVHLEDSEVDDAERRILKSLLEVAKASSFTSSAPLASRSGDRIMLHCGLREGEYLLAAGHLLQRKFIEVKNVSGRLESRRDWIQIAALGRDAYEREIRNMNGPPKGISEVEWRLLNFVIDMKVKHFAPQQMPQEIPLDQIEAVMRKWEAHGLVKTHSSSSSGADEMDMVYIKGSLAFYRDELTQGVHQSQGATTVQITGGVGGHVAINGSSASGNVVHGSIVTSDEVVAALREIVKHLKSDGSDEGKAAGTALERACTMTSKVAVASEVQRAVDAKPSLKDQLLALVSSIGASAAGSALVEGLKFAIT